MGQWSEHFGSVAVARGKEAGEAMLARALPAVAAREVVGPYLFEVREEAAGAVPASVREVIRMRGPSVRLDLGKQAQSGMEDGRVQI